MAVCFSVYFYLSFLGQPGRVLVRIGEALMASLHSHPCRVSLLDFLFFICVYEIFAFLYYTQTFEVRIMLD